MKISPEAEKDEKDYQQILDLSYNWLTLVGIEKITEFMKDKMNIKLSIIGNSFENVGDLVDIVEKNFGKVIYEGPKYNCEKYVSDNYAYVERENDNDYYDDDYNCPDSDAYPSDLMGSY
ncbi:hypothetical protein CDIK_1969 [Cucumispora dikerogammari]|nr:hypothetical protein CDIK_1969 [Cucumispora dikerogammari]